MLVYEKSTFKLKSSSYLWAFIPFMGLPFDVAVGLAMLLLLFPVWAFTFWAALGLRKQVGHKIYMTRTYLRVDNFSTDHIPLIDVVEFRVVNPGRFHSPFLVVNFNDNLKYQQRMGSTIRKAHKWFFDEGIVLDSLSYYREKPEDIVNELNRRLKRNLQISTLPESGELRSVL